MSLFYKTLEISGRVLSGVLILLVKIYQYIISPLLPASCRFYPSCSAYSVQALKMHGPFKGSFLTAVRILRCNPWGAGGIDPVPAEFTFFK